MKHQNAIITFIFNENNSKVLMLKRIKKFGFDWGFVCGKFEDGKTADDCVKRELFEEIGLKNLELYQFKKIKYEKDDETYIHYYYYTTISENTKIDYQTTEIEKIKWFKINELPKSRAPDDPKEALIYQDDNFTMRKQVESIVFRKNNNLFEFLLLKRLPEKGGFWQAVTGEVEKTDISLIKAALREATEEAGVKKKDIIRIINNVHSYEFENEKDNQPVREYVFGIEVNKDFQFTLDKNIYKEHTDGKWVSFEEALKLLKWEENKKAFMKLNNILGAENND